MARNRTFSAVIVACALASLLQEAEAQWTPRPPPVLDPTLFEEVGMPIVDHPQVRCIARHLMGERAYSLMLRTSRLGGSAPPYRYTWTPTFDADDAWWTTTHSFYEEGRPETQLGVHVVLGLRADGFIVVAIRRREQLEAFHNVEGSTVPWLGEWISENFRQGATDVRIVRRPGFPRACRWEALQPELQQYIGDATGARCRASTRQEELHDQEYMVAPPRGEVVCMGHGATRTCLPEQTIVSVQPNRPWDQTTSNQICAIYDDDKGVRHVDWIPTHALASFPWSEWEQWLARGDAPYFDFGRGRWLTEVGRPLIIDHRTADSVRGRYVSPSYGGSLGIRLQRHDQRWQTVGDGHWILRAGNALIVQESDGFEILRAAVRRVINHASWTPSPLTPPAWTARYELIDRGPLSVHRDRSPRARCVFDMLFSAPPDTELGLSTFHADWAPEWSPDGSVTINQELRSTTERARFSEGFRWHVAPDHVVRYLHPSGAAAVGVRQGTTLRVISTHETLPQSGEQTLRRWRTDQEAEILAHLGVPASFTQDIRPVDLTACRGLPAAPVPSRP